VSNVYVYMDCEIGSVKFVIWQVQLKGFNY
jgi:hypothetical protein